MKQRIARKFRRGLTFIMSAIMVVETINCVSMTALASGGSVSAGDAIVLNQDLKDQVNEAESAAIAADEAAKAAAAALEAAEKLAEMAGDAALEIADDGSYTTSVSDGDGNTVEVPVLKEELDDAITDAENKVEDANHANQGILDATEDDIDKLAEQAAADTAEQLQKATDAADTAEEAAKKAQEELAKAQAASDYFTAKQAADAAQAAYNEAQKATDAAGVAYQEAQDILAAAQKAVEDAVAACNDTISSGDATQAAEAAIKNAQEALDAAKAIVDQAQKEYEEAQKNLDDAEKAATEAANKAAAISEGITEDLEDAKGVDVDQLTADKEAAKEDLKKAEEDKVKFDAEQDEIIRQAKLDKEAADSKIEEYNKAKSYTDKMEDKGLFGLSTSDIEEARKVASKTTSDVKYYKVPLLNLGPVYYTQAEIDAAKAIVDEYNKAKALVTGTNLNTLKQASADAQNKINSAINAKNAAALDISNRKTEIARLETKIATVTDYIYNNPNAVVYDLRDDANYKKLLQEMLASNIQYDKSVETRENYQDAIDKDEWWKIITNFEKWLTELNIEFTKNGSEFNWETFSYDTEYGKMYLFRNNNDNVVTLINIENGKLTIAQVDELEFATYAATYDAVAAAESAQKAAEAAQKAQEAKAKLDAANEALRLAQERLDALRIKKMNLDAAKLALAEAERNVELTKAEWEEAKKSAEEAKRAAEEAKLEPETKPVMAAFYVLNRGLAQPSEVASYPKNNYSKKPIYCELYSGALDEATGNRDYSYISLYKKGIKDETLVSQYLKSVPTAEQLADSGVVLKEGESIKWYVIKTEADGYHVDGFIVNQRFNINVLYGYNDEYDNFVEFVKGDGTTYEQSGVFVLGDTYEFTSPVIDDYVAETAIVSGTASSDMTIKVTYTKEETAAVKINYFRGSMTGTLLKTVPLNVAISKVAGYASTISANWLNTEKPADCNNGVLINYYYNEDENVWIANIVYSVIPTDETPTTPPTQVITTEEESEIITIDEEATPTTVRILTPGTPAPAEEEEEQDVIEVEDEGTPLADSTDDTDTASEDQEVVNIEEEDVPLAAGPSCWIHWLILLITAAYTMYELVRSVIRNKKIKELSDNSQSVEA